MEESRARGHCGYTPAWASYFENDRHADVTIVCRDGLEIKAHKIILSLGSPYFDKALNPAHNFKEAQSNRVHLDDEEPAIIRAMLQFIYTGDYSVAPSFPPSSDDCIGTPPDQHQTHDLHIALKFHAALHAAADYFLMPPLASLSFSRFETLATAHWADPAADFPGVIRFVYDTSPPVDACSSSPISNSPSPSPIIPTPSLLPSTSTTNPSPSPNDASSAPPHHNRLRTLLVTLSATHFPTLTTTNPHFNTMMDATGAFGRELASLLAGKTQALQESFGGRHFLCEYCVERYCVPSDKTVGLMCRFCRRGGKVVALAAR
ncbi:BTB/POZ protein [Phyllosticta citricarpa]|uniref:BTB/POZ protein n=1 Tax=Phyllosticta citricarpa TaxID=55181 RepID=A0ABR1MJM4_9PEZI